MPPDSVLQLLAELADVETRRSAARSAARSLGGEDLLVFVRDEETGAYLPALGFPKSLPGGRDWQAFLRRCAGTREPQLDRLRWPDAADPRATWGIGFEKDLVLVLLGDEPRPDLGEELRGLMPLLGSVFKSERAAMTGVAQASSSRAAAVRAEALASSLAESQSELHRSLRAGREVAGLLRGVSQASLLINAEPSLRGLLQTLTDQARLIVGAHQAVTSLTTGPDWAQAINAVSLSDKYAHWRSYDEQPDGSGIYSLVCRTNRPLRLTQAELEAHPAWRGFGRHAGQHPPIRGWLAAPLTGRDGRNLGLVQLSDKQSGEFTAEDEAVLVQLAQLASVAVEKARLIADLEQRSRQAAVGAAVGAALATNRPLREQLRDCTQALVDRLEAAFARIWTLDETAQVLELQASSGLYTHLDGPHGRIPVGRFKIGLIAAERLPHLTNAVLEDPRVSDHAWARQEGMVAFAGYPLIVEDRLVGVIGMFARRPLSDSTLLALASIATQIAVGIERERVGAVLRASEQRHRLLAEASRLLGSAPDPTVTLERVARFLVQSLADFCFFDLVVDGAARRLGGTHVDSTLQPLLAETAPHGLPLDFASRVLGTDTSLLVPRVDAEWRSRMATTSAELELLNRLDPAALLTAPLIIGGRRLGALTLGHASQSKRHFTCEDQSIAEELARRVAYALENARLYLEAEQAVSARDELLAIVAHDLRNPLSAILTTASMLERHGRSSDQGGVLKYAATIHRSAQRMDRLIRDLLDLAALESGHLSIERGPHGVRELLEEVRELQQPIAAGRSILLEVSHPPPGTADVVGDRERLIQVFSNLVGNALKFTPEGGHIRLSAAQDGTLVRFAVSDSGVGIPTDQQQHLFRPYWKATRTSRDGVGLGLSIVKALVEAHGGRVWVESEPGQGATLLFTIPTMEQAPGSELIAPPG